MVATVKQGVLSGLRLLSFESRRAAEIAQLIAGYGGETISAPSMREIPLAENEAIRDFLQRLENGTVDIVVLLTGVGTGALFEILAPRCPPERLAGLLRRTVVVARGPKPRAALRALGLQPDLNVPEPNTWRELVTTVETSCAPLAGKTVALQEYGQANDELISALRGRGAEVLPVPVYRWGLPANLEPLRDGVRALAAGRVDVAIFTSAQQCAHALRMAAELGLESRLRAAAAGVVFASVGPICSQALRAAGLPVDIEPSKPKMGPLIREIAEKAPAILAAKRHGDGD
jgi:uroporphyrinogen-III synthase